jgi:hypothetical protein
MELLQSIFCKDKQKQIEKLKEENDSLKQKLLDKQEQINKTNAYYKRLMHNKKQKK